MFNLVGLREPRKIIICKVSPKKYIGFPKDKDFKLLLELLTSTESIITSAMQELIGYVKSLKRAAKIIQDRNGRILKHPKS